MKEKKQTLLEQLFSNNRKSENDWNFEGEFKYKFQFKISFPIKNGYKETGVINTIVPANSAKQAKIKLNEFVKKIFE